MRQFPSVYTGLFDRICFNWTNAVRKLHDFGEGKAWHAMERFRLWRLRKVNIEGLLQAAGQNLKRLLGWRGWGRRWWREWAMRDVSSSVALAGP